MGSDFVRMRLGDVKLSGRITASTRIGDALALIKIFPLPATSVKHNPCRHQLHGALENPRLYNVMHIDEAGICGFYFLPDDCDVIFFLDFTP